MFLLVATLPPVTITLIEYRLYIQTMSNSQDLPPAVTPDDFPKILWNHEKALNDQKTSIGKIETELSKIVDFLHALHPPAPTNTETPLLKRT